MPGIIDKIKSLFLTIPTSNNHIIESLATDKDPNLNWSFIESIGDGSFGQISKVKNNSTDLFAALKEVNLEDDIDLSRVETEINILKRCNNKNIILLYEAFCYKGKLMMYLEYCNIGSLDAIILELERPLLENEICCVSMQVSNGLQYLHDKNIIHRDIKAANLLLCSDATVKIGDFGVSALTDSSNGKRSTFIGSTFWMAPEVIICETNYTLSYDCKADVWSFGITLIELAQMEPPYGNMNQARVLLRILKAEPPTLNDPKSWSDDFNDVISQCLKKNPIDRPTFQNLKMHKFHEGTTDLTMLLKLISEIKADVTVEIKDPTKDSNVSDSSTSSTELSSFNHSTTSIKSNQSIDLKDSPTSNKIFKDIATNSLENYEPGVSKNTDKNVLPFENIFAKIKCDNEMNNINTDFSKQYLTPNFNNLDKEPASVPIHSPVSFIIDLLPSKNSSYVITSPLRSMNSHEIQIDKTNKINDEIDKLSSNVFIGDNFTLKNKSMNNVISHNVHTNSFSSLNGPAKNSCTSLQESESSPNFSYQKNAMSLPLYETQKLTMTILDETNLYDELPIRNISCNDDKKTIKHAKFSMDNVVGFHGTFKPGLMRTLASGQLVGRTPNNLNNDESSIPQEKACNIVAPTLRNNSQYRSMTKTRTYVYEGNVITRQTSKLMLLGLEDQTNQFRQNRKASMRASRMLQVAENRQLHQLKRTFHNKVEQLTETYDYKRQDCSKIYSLNQENMIRRHKQDILNLESKHAAQLKLLVKNIKNDQDNEYRLFDDNLKRELKQLKQDFEYKRGHKDFRLTALQQKEAINQEALRTFCQRQADILDMSVLRIQSQQVEEMANLEAELLHEKHELIRSYEGSMWQLEEERINERTEIHQEEIKNFFELQLQHLSFRHEQDLDQVKKCNEMDLALLLEKQMSDRKVFAKQQKYDSKKRIAICKEAIRIGEKHVSLQSEREYIREIEINEKKKINESISKYEKAQQKFIQDFHLQSATINKEIEQAHIEQQRTLHHQFESQILEESKRFNRELKKWENMMMKRKQMLEDEFAKQRFEQESFYKPMHRSNKYLNLSTSNDDNKNTNIKNSAFLNNNLVKSSFSKSSPNISKSWLNSENHVSTVL